MEEDNNIDTKNILNQKYHARDVRFKLFHSPVLRSVRVKWMLHELLGNQFDLQVVDIYGGEQYQKEYLSINPNHNVPTLQITWPDKTVTNMIESSAMVALLADTFPEAGLSPAPGILSKERVDYLQMLHFGATMDWMLWQIRLNTLVFPDDQKDERTVRRYKKKFATEVEPQLRHRLERHAYICGDAFSAADCVISHGVGWARGHGLCGDDCFTRYLSNLSLRPAYRLAYSDAAQFVPEIPRTNPVIHLVTG